MKKIKFLDYKNNFLGIKNPSNKKSKVYIVPYGLEKTTSYGKGTSKGPAEILKASHQIELFDDELKLEPCNFFYPLTLDIDKIPSSHIKALKNLENIVNSIVKLDKLPIILGGEHSITSFCIKPILDRYKKLTVVQFDAHADLRNTYQNEKNSHACAMRRCLDNRNLDIISIGTRSISKDEFEFFRRNEDRIKIYWARNNENWNLKKLQNSIKDKNIYISFDLDAFDSSIMPATGTPEPGGLSWYQALNILKIICKNSNIVGADINELSPIKKIDSYNFTAAKLIYKIISYSILKNYL